MDLDHRDVDGGHHHAQDMAAGVCYRAAHQSDRLRQRAVHFGGQGHAHAHTREEVRSGTATTDGSDAGHLVRCAPQHGGRGALGYPQGARGAAEGQCRSRPHLIMDDFGHDAGDEALRAGRFPFPQSLRRFVQCRVFDGALRRAWKTGSV